MLDPREAWLPTQDPGSAALREPRTQIRHPDGSQGYTPAPEQQLAALQQERQMLSRLLRRLPETVQRGGPRSRQLVLDAWCWRVLEVELEMDRLRQAIPAELSIPPLEVRLIQQLFSSRWHRERMRRRASTKVRLPCRPVDPRKRMPLACIGEPFPHRTAPRQIVNRLHAPLCVKLTRLRRLCAVSLSRSLTR